MDFFFPRMCACVQLSAEISVCQKSSRGKRGGKKRLEMVDALIQNIFTSHEHDCNFKPLRESSCGALTGRR